MATLVVVGGGVSGLAAAWAARRAADAADAPLRVIVLESGEEPGGKVRTLRRDGFIVEAGPTSFSDDSAELDAMLRDTGLDARKLRPAEDAARRYLVRHGKLVEIGPSRGNPLGKGLLSPLGIARMFYEPFVPRGGSERESLWDFAARRLGKQAADRLVAPMALGVVAGDAKRLSATATFPAITALEREHGSLLRGMLAKGRARRAARQRGERVTGGGLSSFDEGMQSLPRALAQVPGVELRTRARVQALRREADGGFEVRLPEGSIHADAVIVATESDAAAVLLGELAPEAAARLKEIAVAPIAVVSLGFRAESLPDLPRGFGALVPRAEPLRHLGTLWESRIFPSRAPAGNVLLRVMFGGAVDPSAAMLDEKTLLELALAELNSLTRVTAPPVLQVLTRWDRAIPQYDLVHPERRREVESHLSRVPGLFLAGTSLRGVGVPRAVESGIAAGREAVALCVTEDRTLATTS